MGTVDRCPTCKRSYPKGRSNNQNRYYFGVVIDLISEHTGFTPEEVHEILKHKFLMRHKTFNEMIFQVSKSTTELTTKQMEEYLSNIRIWASSELSCYVPEPREIIDKY